MRAEAQRARVRQRRALRHRHRGAEAAAPAHPEVLSPRVRGHPPEAPAGRLEAEVEGDPRVAHLGARFDVGEEAGVANALPSRRPRHEPLAPHLLAGHPVGPGMGVHHRLARGPVEREGQRRGGDARRAPSPVAHQVVLRDHVEHRVAALLGAPEGGDDVVLPLVLLAADAALRVQLHREHELDVGGPSPGGHQAVERGPAVLVAEDHRVPQLAAPVPAHARLDPGQERHVAEPVERARPGVEDRSVGQLLVPGLARGDGLDRDRLDPDRSGSPRRALRVAGQGQAVGAGAERAEQDAVLGRGPAEEDEVLRPDAVDGQGQDRGLAALRPPVAALARRGDGGHRLGLAVEVERVLVERRGGREQESEEDPGHRLRPGSSSPRSRGRR